MADSRDMRTLHLLFDVTPEIFATDSAGAFAFPLAVGGKAPVETEVYDEIRFVFSVWHPSGQKVIDLDRATTGAISASFVQCSSSGSKGPWSSR